MCPVKAKQQPSAADPIVVREGSVSVIIYPTVNRIYRANSRTGQRELKSTHPQFTLAYYHGSKRVRKKFTDLAKAKAEANLVVIKLANGESEALKLKGADRSDYVRAVQLVREWKPGADLCLTVA